MRLAHQIESPPGSKLRGNEICIGPSISKPQKERPSHSQSGKNEAILNKQSSVLFGFCESKFLFKLCVIHLDHWIPPDKFWKPAIDIISRKRQKN